MEKELLLGALDRAITRVAHNEFQRLSTGMTIQQLTHKVHQTLDSLAGLQRGNPPDYNDPWIALFYLTWYQPGQIQLAHILIEAQKGARQTSLLLADDFQRLHVVDFGCGALAMKFAVAWAAADALENGEQISSINVDSYDPNPAMVRIGSYLWQEFKAEIPANPQFTHLLRTINIITDRQHTNPDFAINIDQHSTHVWLSAIHATYRNNTQQVGPNLANFSRITEPDIGFLSGNYHTVHPSLLHQVSPFREPQYVHYEGQITSEFNDILPMLTVWRRNRLNARISPSHNFLNTQVTWSFPSALGCIYIKAR